MIEREEAHAIHIATTEQKDGKRKVAVSSCKAQSTPPLKRHPDVTLDICDRQVYFHHSSTTLLHRFDYRSRATLHKGQHELNLKFYLSIVERSEKQYFTSPDLNHRIKMQEGAQAHPNLDTIERPHTSTTS